MSLARLRRPGSWLLHDLLAVALVFIFTMQGCSRSSPPTEKKQKAQAAPPASTTPKGSDTDKDDDETAKAVGSLLGQLMKDAAPTHRKEGAAESDSQELKPPPGLDLGRAPQIPLTEGLTVVTAVADPKGDYESVKRIASVDAERVRVSYSATNRGTSDGWKEVRSARIVLAEDLKAGRTYRMAFTSGQTQTFRGATALGVSSAVLEELRDTGRSECSLASIDTVDMVFGGVGLPSPEYEGTLERVEKGPVPVPVLLDGVRQWLPTVHVRGTFEALSGDIDAEFWFLDNPANALTLRARLGKTRLVAIRIDRPREVAARLEETLASEDRVELPGIYFEFASAALRPESEATITEVADLLRRRSDWRIRFEGHTDNIGTADANLDLSKRRAEAVRAAVVQKLGGGADRFESGGYGAMRPRERNDTPEGRARNRRVEMIRLR